MDTITHAQDPQTMYSSCFHNFDLFTREVQIIDRYKDWKLDAARKPYSGCEQGCNYSCEQ